MTTFVTVVHVFTCIFLVLLVLVQSGKGAEISASFAGSSQTVFGSSGGANFFTKLTAGFATVFMLTSLGLTVLGARSAKSIFEGSPAEPAAPAAQSQQQPAQPATDGAAKPADSGAAAPAAPAEQK